MLPFIQLNADQRRETVNTQQRFRAWNEALVRKRSYRGSMVWSDSKGRSYLTRSSYDKRGKRRQTSLGLKTERTETIKAAFDSARAEAAERVEALTSVMARQAAINRAVGLSRVPALGARILRALDAHGVLGNGIRVLGTNAIYAYEAVAGVHVQPDLTTTEDIGLLLDTRRQLAIIATDDADGISLLRILQRVDKSFRRTRETFRAANKNGYLVDLIKPLRDPPWTREAGATRDADDLQPVEITGLAWLESASAFEALAIDDRGEPVRIVTCDPRAFAAHKLWLSARSDREPIKRRRDREQAKAVGALTARFLPHLPFDADELRMLPREVVDAAAPLFVPIDEGAARD